MKKPRKKGSGRKPVKDKRVSARVWTNKSRVKKLGVKTCSQIGEQAIEFVYNENLNLLEELNKTVVVDHAYNLDRFVGRFKDRESSKSYEIRKKNYRKQLKTDNHGN